MFWQWIVGAIGFVWICVSGAKFSEYQAIFNCVGIFLVFVGIGGRLYATLYIGGMKNAGKDGNSFISDGIYSVCRNPLYLFSFIGFVGLLCFKGQILLILLGAIIFLLIYRWTILGEEEFLRQKYGKKYEEFLASSPRFLPKISNFNYPDRLEIQPFFLHKEIARSFVWLVGAFGIYIIGVLQAFEILPILLEIY